MEMTAARSPNGFAKRCMLMLVSWVAAIAASATPPALAAPPSPLDALDASRMDAKDRISGLPTELVAILGSYRGRHAEPVTCLAVSPDGRWLASGSRDRTVRLWVPATLAQRQVLTGYVGDVHSVVFSSDSKRIFSTAEDGKVHIDQLHDSHWTPLKSVPLIPRGLAVVFPDAATVLSSAWPRTNNDLRLFRLVGNRVESTPADLTGLIQWPEGGAALSPDGRWLACGGTGKAKRGLAIVVFIWDLRDRASRPRWTLDMPMGHIHSVAFSPDGHTLLVGDDQGAIALWSFGESAPQKRAHLAAHKGAVNVLVFSPDGKRLVSGSYDNQIGVWNWQEG
jgi:WD40 repeat protein